MNKKITKLLLILLTIFVVYFIKMNEVGAYREAGNGEKRDSDDHTTYIQRVNEDGFGNPKYYDFVSAINPLDSNNVSRSINFQMYQDKTKPAKAILAASYAKYYVLNHGTKDGTFNIGLGFDYKNPLRAIVNNTKVSFFNIYKGAVKEIATLQMHSLSEESYSVESIYNKYGYSKTEILSITEKTKKNATFDNVKNSDYIKYDGEKFVESNETEYEEFVKNQYEKVKKIGTYKFANDNSCLGVPDDMKNMWILSLRPYLNNDLSINSCLKTYSSGGFDRNQEIVFVSTKRQQKYNGDNLTKLFGYMDKYADATKEEIESAKEKMNQLIDTGTYDTRTFTDKYYKATKESMFNFMVKYLNSDIDSVVEFTNKPNFANWFDLVGRYILEDDIQLYKKYFEFIFADSTSPKDSNGDYTKPRTSNNVFGIEFTEQQYKIVLDSINQMIGTLKTCGIYEKTIQDTCIIYCPQCLEDENSTKCTTCINEKTGKKGYVECISCKKSCSSVPGATYDKCFDGCLDGKLSNGGSKYYHETLSEMTNSSKEKCTEFATALVETLNKLDLDPIRGASAPSPNFHFGTYIANCDDVKVVHTIYKFMIYLAPILVIVLGVIDYAKAMMNSDESKQQKFKKSFKKRVILLVLLILVPIIISIILDLYNSATDNSLENNLMYCVVKGSK